MGACVCVSKHGWVGALLGAARMTAEGAAGALCCSLRYSQPVWAQSTSPCAEKVLSGGALGLPERGPLAIQHARAALSLVQIMLSLLH